MGTYINELIEMERKLEDIKILGDSASFKELEFSKQKRRYDDITKNILNCSLIPFTQESSILSKEYVEKLLFEILSELFPTENINSFIEKIKISKNIPSNKYDCVTETSMDKKLVHIHIGGYNNLGIIPNLGHAFIHGNFEVMDPKLLIKRISNYHYKYIASIVAEMIIADMAEEKTELPIIMAMNHLRIDQIKTINEIYKMMQENEHKAKTEPLALVAMTFQKHETFTYTISDIYATNLFHFYKQNKIEFLKLFNGMLKDKLTIVDLLNYYGISLSNLETANQYNKKIQSVSK